MQTVTSQHINEAVPTSYRRGVECLQISGNWALVVKRDYFNKVAGGVRQQEKLDAHSELVKIR